MKAILLAGLALCAAGARADAKMTVYTENKNVFRNPGQGWCAAYKPVEAFDGLVNIGAVYDRFCWRALEPEEGRYDWSPIDRQIEHARTNGVPYYVRIMCVNGASRRRRDAPDWFYAKPGVQIHRWHGEPYKDWSNGGKETTEREAPYFDDPVFLAAHGRFLRALAARYDGHPMIGGVDIGSYGNFGEWHCWPMKYPREFGPDCRRRIADMYLDGFTRTPLVFMCDDAETFAYVQAKRGRTRPRIGVRQDSMGSAAHMARFVGTPPCDRMPSFPDIWRNGGLVFLEFHGGVDWFSLHERNAWYRGRQLTIPAAVDWILANHASLVNTCPMNPGDVRARDPASFAAFRQIDLYAGARLVPLFAETSRDGGVFRARLGGINKGCAPILLPYRAVYRFRDAAGRIVFERAATADVRTFLPGTFGLKDEFPLPPPAADAAASLAIVHVPGVLPDFRLAADGLTAHGELPLP